ncbi:hypothetical protein QPL79_05140 [Ignisphaera sp. 4213-co]|uniref:DUF1616 domain-containing protein n=1 Tax=Ignisphaera cupida TaxID=3050454 RepID=A0ABD4Z611_9CREN|nr:hypothetical protein [Ignisphaera sp. 4213-co]MDK6028741.1 hypothetical protein [Ignisphaera sp. 4213-co]
MDRALLLTAISILAAAFIAASVFAYYPLKLVVQPVTPPITFVPGTNANKSDLGSTDLGSSNTITVSLGKNSTSAEITIHPTYHTTYYKNVMMIVNNDTKAYNVSLVVDTVSNNLPPGSKVYMIVFSSGASRSLSASYPEPGLPSSYVRVINLTNIRTRTSKWIQWLDANSIWEIDFMVYIPEGASLTDASATFGMHLVYSPSEETPP